MGPWEAQVGSYLRGPYGLYGAYFFQLILLWQNHHSSHAVSPAAYGSAVLQKHSLDSRRCCALPLNSLRQAQPRSHGSTLMHAVTLPRKGPSKCRPASLGASV